MCDTQVNGRPHLKSPSLRFPSQFFTECSGDHHGLAEDLRPEDEGGPDVGPDRQVGGLTGVVSHVNLGPELSLLVLDGV